MFAKTATYWRVPILRYFTAISPLPAPRKIFVKQKMKTSSNSSKADKGAQTFIVQIHLK